jgi:hypothetical protein
MRCLERNKRLLYYAKYIGRSEGRDSDGFLTGEEMLEYEDAKAWRVNITPATGDVSQQAFGAFQDYTAVLCTTDDCPVTEESRLWIGRAPKTAHNYVVKRIAKSLNSTLIAVKELPGK